MKNLHQFRSRKFTEKVNLSGKLLLLFVIFACGAHIAMADWFENFYTFGIILNARKSYRVQELSNPTRLVIDFKH